MAGDPPYIVVKHYGVTDNVRTLIYKLITVNVEDYLDWKPSSTNVEYDW